MVTIHGCVVGAVAAGCEAGFEVGCDDGSVAAKSVPASGRAPSTLRKLNKEIDRLNTELESFRKMAK